MRNEEEAIFSQQVEYHVLAGLVVHPEVFPEICRYINEKDFYNQVHHTIFRVLSSILVKKLEVDPILLVDKIVSMNVRFKDEIDIATYIDNMTYTQIKPDGVIDNARLLLKYRMRRDTVNTAKDLINYAHKCGNESVDEIISTSDRIYNKKIRSYTSDDDPEDLLENLGDVIEERGNNPIKDIGLPTPWTEFNRMYGGLRPGNIYAVCSRPGHGKTTWINEICLRTAYNSKIPCLMLDTEVETSDIQFRTAAAILGVPFHYLETGKWRRNEEMFTKVRKLLPELKKYKGVKHMYVASKNVDQICALVRRWHMSEVGRGNPCIVSYDYIKLTGEKLASNENSWEKIGQKITALNELSKEINAPMIVANQLNKAGESGATGQPQDDSAAFAASDFLQQYASYTGIFRRKTNEERGLDGEDFGTHKLITTKSRFQGEEAPGHLDQVWRRLPDGRRRPESVYLNYEVVNFRVDERGSLRHIIARDNERYLAEGGAEADGEIFD
jgi:replicative DNA helicase